MNIFNSFVENCKTCSMDWAIPESEIRTAATTVSYKKSNSIHPVISDRKNAEKPQADTIILKDGTVVDRAWSKESWFIDKILETRYGPDGKSIVGGNNQGSFREKACNMLANLRQEVSAEESMAYNKKCRKVIMAAAKQIKKGEKIEVYLLDDVIDALYLRARFTATKLVDLYLYESNHMAYTTCKDMGIFVDHLLFEVRKNLEMTMKGLHVIRKFADNIRIENKENALKADSLAKLLMSVCEPIKFSFDMDEDEEEPAEEDHSRRIEMQGMIDGIMSMNNTNTKPKRGVIAADETESQVTTEITDVVVSMPQQSLNQGNAGGDTSTLNVISATNNQYSLSTNTIRQANGSNTVTSLNISDMAMDAEKTRQNIDNLQQKKMDKIREDFIMNKGKQKKNDKYDWYNEAAFVEKTHIKTLEKQIEKMQRELERAKEALLTDEEREALRVQKAARKAENEAREWRERRIKNAYKVLTKIILRFHLKLRLWKRFQSKQAVKIQRFVRFYIVFKRLRRIIKIITAERRAHYIIKKCIMKYRISVWRRRKAAIVIQRWMRKRLIREFYRRVARSARYAVSMFRLCYLDGELQRLHVRVNKLQEMLAVLDPEAVSKIILELNSTAPQRSARDIYAFDDFFETLNQSATELGEKMDLLDKSQQNVLLAVSTSARLTQLNNKLVERNRDDKKLPIRINGGDTPLLRSAVQSRRNSLQSIAEGSKTRVSSKPNTASNSRATSSRGRKRSVASSGKAQATDLDSNVPKDSILTSENLGMLHDLLAKKASIKSGEAETDTAEIVAATDKVLGTDETVTEAVTANSNISVVSPPLSLSKPNSKQDRRGSTRSIRSQNDPNDNSSADSPRNRRRGSVASSNNDTEQVNNTHRNSNTSFVNYYQMVAATQDWREILPEMNYDEMTFRGNHLNDKLLMKRIVRLENLSKTYRDSVETDDTLELPDLGTALQVQESNKLLFASKKVNASDCCAELYSPDVREDVHHDFGALHVNLYELLTRRDIASDTRCTISDVLSHNLLDVLTGQNGIDTINGEVLRLGFGSNASSSGDSTVTKLLRLRVANTNKGILKDIKLSRSELEKHLSSATSASDANMEEFICNTIEKIFKIMIHVVLPQLERNHGCFIDRGVLTIPHILRKNGVSLSNSGAQNNTCTSSVLNDIHASIENINYTVSLFPILGLGESLVSIDSKSPLQSSEIAALLPLEEQLWQTMEKLSTQDSVKPSVRRPNISADIINIDLEDRNLRSDSYVVLDNTNGIRVPLMVSEDITKTADVIDRFGKQVKFPVNGSLTLVPNEQLVKTIVDRNRNKLQAEIKVRIINPSTANVERLSTVLSKKNVIMANDLLYCGIKKFDSLSIITNAIQYLKSFHRISKELESPAVISDELESKPSQFEEDENLLNVRLFHALNFYCLNPTALRQSRRGSLILLFQTLFVMRDKYQNGIDGTALLFASKVLSIVSQLKYGQKLVQMHKDVSENNSKSVLRRRALQDILQPNDDVNLNSTQYMLAETISAKDALDVVQHIFFGTLLLGELPQFGAAGSKVSSNTLTSTQLLLKFSCLPEKTLEVIRCVLRLVGLDFSAVDSSPSSSNSNKPVSQPSSAQVPKPPEVSSMTSTVNQSPRMTQMRIKSNESYLIEGRHATGADATIHQTKAQSTAVDNNFLVKTGFVHIINNNRFQMNAINDKKLRDGDNADDEKDDDKNNEDGDDDGITLEDSVFESVSDEVDILEEISLNLDSIYSLEDNSIISDCDKITKNLLRSNASGKSKTNIFGNMTVHNYQTIATRSFGGEADGKDALEKALVYFDKYLVNAKVNTFELIMVLLPYHIQQSKLVEHSLKWNTLFNRLDHNKVGKISKSVFLGFIENLLIKKVLPAHRARSPEFELADQICSQVLIKLNQQLMDFFAFQVCLRQLVDQEIISLENIL